LQWLKRATAVAAVARKKSKTVVIFLATNDKSETLTKGYIHAHCEANLDN